MKSLIIGVTTALAVIAAVQFFNQTPIGGARMLGSEVDAAFVAWKQKFGKAYGTYNEEAYRRSIFGSNYAYAKDSNAKMIAQYGDHPETLKLGMTQFADLSREEFKKQYLGAKAPRAYGDNNKTKELPEDNLPTDVDWWAAGYTTPVKNQGMCGSCWAFSGTGGMEGAYYKAHGQLVSFSEQQHVDCDHLEGSQGCNGGWMYAVFEYGMQHDLDTEDQYAYTGQDGTCHEVASGIRVNDWFNVPVNRTKQLLAALASAGPVSVGIEADGLVFQLYIGGTVIETACGTNVDHGVLVTGYKVGTLSNYWVVKNSWGSMWGAEGYVYIRAVDSDNDAGVCGINQTASYAIFA